jgi:hypothetical protein
MENSMTLLPVVLLNRRCLHDVFFSHTIIHYAFLPSLLPLQSGAGSTDLIGTRTIQSEPGRRTLCLLRKSLHSTDRSIDRLSSVVSHFGLASNKDPPLFFCRRYSHWKRKVDKDCNDLAWSSIMEWQDQTSKERLVSGRHGRQSLAEIQS